MAQASPCTELIRFSTGAEMPEGAICTTSRMLGSAHSVDCRWSYPYRDVLALHAFEDLLAMVTQCTDEEIVEDEAQVNHPDSYDLRQFRLGESVVSLSLKDKGALGQSLVFLRASQPAS